MPFEAISVVTFLKVGSVGNQQLIVSKFAKQFALFIAVEVSP